MSICSFRSFVKNVGVLLAADAVFKGEKERGRERERTGTLSCGKKN